MHQVYVVAYRDEKSLRLKCIRVYIYEKTRILRARADTFKPVSYASVWTACSVVQTVDDHRCIKIHIKPCLFVRLWLNLSHNQCIIIINMTTTIFLDTFDQMIDF